MPSEPARRPRVHLNCAVSLDGRLAFAGGRRALLSGPNDLLRVQRIRASSDAILVGVGTVISDDPGLRVHWDLLRTPVGREPLRIVLDSRGRTPPSARILQTPPRTLVATSSDCERSFPQGVEQFHAGARRVDLAALLEHLTAIGVRALLVEGGAEVLASFLRLGLVDAMTVYVAPVIIGGRTAPTMVAGPETPGPEQLVRLRRTGAEPLDDGVLLTYAPGDGPGAGLSARAPL